MAQSTFVTSTARSRPVLIALALLVCLGLSIVSFGRTSDYHASGLNQVSSSLQKGVNATLEAAESANRDVLLYAYYETDDARRNLQFFVNHALHDKLDFIFIINGDALTVKIPRASNINIIHRANTCYDLGSFGEVLTADNSALRKRYDRFILMNSSIRGPFMPGWSRNIRACWSDIFLKTLNDKTKLAGLSANCDPDYRKHIQSMLLAVDEMGLDLIIPGLRCASNYGDAITFGELAITMLVREAGFDAEPLYSLRYRDDYKTPEDFWDSCDNLDIYFPERNGGMDTHPFDTVFVKTQRSQDGHVIPGYSEPGQLVVDRLTEWMDFSEYSSYDYC